MPKKSETFRYRSLMPGLRDEYYDGLGRAMEVVIIGCALFLVVFIAASALVWLREPQSVWLWCDMLKLCRSRIL